MGLDAERARDLNREIRERAVDRTYDLLRVAKGTSETPTKKEISESLDFILDECLGHPDYQDEEYFWGSSGFCVLVQRDAYRHWHTYQVLVPATPHQIEYKADMEESGATDDSGS